jgi:hypothetical protein
LKKIFILAAVVFLIFAGLFSGGPSSSAASSLQEFKSKGKVNDDKEDLPIGGLLGATTEE